MVFFTVLMIATSLCWWFIRVTKGITYFGPNSDAQKQMDAAAYMRQWRWLSDMHKFAQEKSRMKDAVILVFGLMQKLLNDNKTEHVVVSACALAHTVSSVLVFLIAAHFGGQYLGLVVFLLYIGCFWPWQVALWGGHICIGIMFFLCSICCLLFLSNEWSWGGYFFSGVLFTITQFSSSSSRKLAPLYVATWWLIQQQHGGLQSIIKDRMVEGIINPGAVLFLALGLGVFIFKCLRGKMVITLIYEQKAPAWLNVLIEKEKKYSLAHYQMSFEHSLDVLTKIFIGLAVYSIGNSILFGFDSFISLHVPIFLGLVLMALVFLLPNIPVHLKGYLRYYNIAKVCDHYKIYRDHYAKIGHPIKDHFRGEGAVWLVKYFWLMTPLLLILDVLGIVVVLVCIASGNFGDTDILMALLVFLAAWSSVIFAECTGCLQLGRAYLPVLLGHVLWIGYSFYVVNRFLVLGFWFNVGVAGFFLVYFYWNARIWMTDIFPARMVIAWLIRDLKQKGYTQIITYNTKFNEVFIGSIYPKDQEVFKINFISSLKEIDDIHCLERAVVVAPGVSSKALNMETQPEGISNEDFRKDPILNNMIDSGKIDQWACLRYKTVGTSRFWGHESDALSFRDLILKEITSRDRWLAHLWVIDVKTIKECVQAGD